MAKKLKSAGSVADCFKRLRSSTDVAGHPLAAAELDALQAAAAEASMRAYRTAETEGINAGALTWKADAISAANRAALIEVSRYRAAVVAKIKGLEGSLAAAREAAASRQVESARLSSAAVNAGATGSLSISQPRAKEGGEYGPNGEWYPGGAFIATTEMPKKLRDKIKKAASGTEQIEIGFGADKRSVIPPGKLPIVARLMGTVLNHDGSTNDRYLEYSKYSPDYIAQAKEAGKRYAAGERLLSVAEFPLLANFTDGARMMEAGMTVPGDLVNKMPADVGAMLKPANGNAGATASLGSVNAPEQDIRSRSFRQMLEDEGINIDELDDATALAESEQPGQRTVGRPELGMSTLDPRIMAIDEVREPRQETFDQWDREAGAMLANDYEGTVRMLVKRGQARGTDAMLSPAETRAAQLIMVAESKKPMTREQVRRLQWLAYSYRNAGTEQARGLASRRDPFKTPEERHREFLMRTIYTPSPKARKALENADTFADRERIMIEQANEIERIKKELARMGITLENIFAQEVALSLKASAAAKAAVAAMGSAARQKAAAMLQDHRGDGNATKVYARIANETGLTMPEIEAVHNEVMAKARQEAMKKMREALARAAAARGQNLKSQPMGDDVPFDIDALLNLPAAEREARMNELADQMVEAMGWLPKAKLGKVKQVKRKRKPLFRPPPPRRAGAPEATQPELPTAPPPRGTSPVGNTRGDQTTLPGWQQPGPVGPLGRSPAATANDQGTLPGWQQPGPVGPLGRGTTPAAGDQATLPGWQSPAPVGPLGRAPSESTAGEQPDWARTFFPGTPWEGEMLVPVGADLGRMEDVISIARAASIARASGFDMLTEWWINNLLSGPTTHIRNLAGNLTSFGLVNTIYRGIETLMRGQPAEMRHLWKGLVPGIARGWRLAKMAWVHQADFFRSDILDDQVEFNGLVKGEGTRAAIPGKFGDIVRIPGRMLAFSDALFKGILAQMEAGAQAFRIAKAEGLSGEALSRRMNQELSTPNSKAWQLAVEKAMDATFQTELKPLKDQPPVSGPVSAVTQASEAVARGVSDFANSFTILKWIVPFIRTPFNLLRTGLRISPVGSLTLAEELIHGGLVKMRDGRAITTVHQKILQHAAEQLVAWTAAAVLAGAIEGDDDDDDQWLLITGTKLKGAAGDQQARTYPATSIRLFGKWFNYGSIEPVATALGAFADAVRHGKTGTGSLVGSLRGQIDSKTFMRGLSELFDNLDRMTPQTDAGGNIREPQVSMNDALLKLAVQTVVPNLIRQPLRAADEYERDWKSKEWWHDAMPTGAGAAPQINTVTGEEIRKPGNTFTRLFFPFLSEAPAEIAAADKMVIRWNRENPGKRWAPDEPDRTLFIMRNGAKEKVELGPKAYEYLQKRSAVIARRNMPASFPSVPTKQDVDSLKSAFQEARATAREELRRWAPERLVK